MLGTFLIFAREGIEGTLICSILLTFLASADRRDLFKWVFFGAAAAVVVATAGGVVLWMVSRDAFIGSDAQTWFETGVFMVAVAVLTSMTVWMRRHSPNMGRELREKVSGAVASGSGSALALVAFVTVGREAVETAIFLLAIAYRSSPLQLSIGAALGLAVAITISLSIYKLGRHINLGRFFTIMGTLLMVVAAGLLADVVQNLQQLGVLPGRSMTVWNITKALPDNAGVGDVLHGLVGYAARPTLLQVGVWLLFLAGSVTLFFVKPRREAKASGASARASGGSS